MSSAFNQLSASFARLSSLERRFIILVAVIIFIVINLLFVLPYFSKLSQIENRFGEANSKLEKYQKEIAQIPTYEKGVKEMEGEGATVPPEDQSVNFMMAIQNQAVQNGVSLGPNNRQPTRTNANFVELSAALTTQSGEAQLVNFLHSLGAGNSLIRARALSIRPDPQRTGLSATMTLIASYQKKPPTRTTSAAKSPASTPSAAPASKPGNTPAGKPATTAATPAVKTNQPVGNSPATKSLTPPKKP